MTGVRDVSFNGGQVFIEWTDGHKSVFSNKRLRDSCPCASCRGEVGLLGKAYMLPSSPDSPEDVRVVRHAMVGRYAISFLWSDGHSTGIYPYEYLLDRCECADCSHKRLNH